MLRMTMMAVLGLALSTGALQAEVDTDAAATSGDVMVRVDISAVAGDLAEALDTDKDALPRSVEVPIETASRVCDMPVDQLEVFRAADQDLECNASSVSPELTEKVGDEIPE